ncbi:MAG: methyltransferase [Halobacteriota archaeon]
MSLLLRRDDRAYLVEPGDRLETDLGILEVPADAGPGDRLETHLGTAFLVLAPRSIDLFDHLERRGAPMLPRDIGLVIGLAGLGAGDRVFDVGTGPGILAISLARLGVEVETYERDAEAAETARANLERAGVSELVELHEVDATSADPSGEFDAMVLDTGDAASLIERAPDILSEGGVSIAYTPFVEDARAVNMTATSTGLEQVRTVETIQRDMDFDGRGSRPSTGPVGHTGYLTVARYLPVPE